MVSCISAIWLSSICFPFESLSILGIIELNISWKKGKFDFKLIIVWWYKINKNIILLQDEESWRNYQVVKKQRCNRRRPDNTDKVKNEEIMDKLLYNE